MSFTASEKHQSKSERALVQIIQKYPREVLAKISPAGARLKPFINYPLIYTNFTIGAFAATSLTWFKFVGEILTNGLLMEMFGLTLFLSVFGIVIAVLQTVLLNQLMQWYDQIDVQPCYQCFVLVLPISFGLFLLNEIVYYTQNELICLFIGVGTVFIGIRFIVTKTRLSEKMADEEKRKSTHPQDDYLNADKLPDAERCLFDDLRASRREAQDNDYQVLDNDQSIPHFN